VLLFAKQLKENLPGSFVFFSAKQLAEPPYVFSRYEFVHLVASLSLLEAETSS
jgi:hypothetical protein